jgi:myo-inositol catabolism protein IolS
MNYRKLGNSDVAVSEISLGCWTMGGLNWVDGQANGWANVNEDEITAAVKRAVDAGVNHFDNADVYGNGRAERMLARVLKKLGLKSEQFIIATKVGHFRGTAEHAYDPLHIRHQCEQSLRNLQREYVDIYYLHHGDFGPSGEWLAGAAATLDALVQEGKVRLKGQSAYSDGDFQRAVPVVRPTVLQSWANALRPNFIKPNSVVGKLLAEYSMSFVAFSPLQKGLLLDKFDPEHPPSFDEGDIRRTDSRFAPEFLRALKPKLAQLKARFGATPDDLAAVALRYVLNHPHVACVIPGFRNERQVAANLGGVQRALSAADIALIDQIFAA